MELAKNKKEELTIKLEAMGYDVGYRFAERCVALRDDMRDCELLVVVCQALIFIYLSIFYGEDPPRTGRACSSRWT